MVLGCKALDRSYGGILRGVLWRSHSRGYPKPLDIWKMCKIIHDVVELLMMAQLTSAAVIAIIRSQARKPGTTAGQKWPSVGRDLAFERFLRQHQVL